MEIRTTTPADAEAVRNVHRASIEGLGPSAYTQEQVNAWARGCESADYVAAITSDDLYFIIAEDDEEVLGFGSLCFESPSEYESFVDAEITGVYVHPSVTRNGVGTAILMSLEQKHEGGTIGRSVSQHHSYCRT